MMAEMSIVPSAFNYRNHRGETSRRRVLPLKIWFGITDWHPAPQWFLRAFDLDKMAERDFSMHDIRDWGLA